MPKLPAVPPGPEQLRATDPEWRALAPHTVLWRIHSTAGPHPQPWNTLRHYGPVASCRFDPHSGRPGPQARGVAYLALGVPTALAEVFQVTRRVNRHRGAPYLTAFRPTRALRLLDLSGGWPVRAGASHALNTGRRDVTRSWARAFLAAWPELDGLWHTSAMTGLPCVTLFTGDCFPDVPDFTAPLSQPGLLPHLATACQQIGYHLL